MTASAEISVREATVEDVPTILNFIRELAIYEKALEKVEATPETLEATLFKDHFAYVLIAEIPGNEAPKPVGFSLYFYAYSTWWAAPTLHLEDLFVLPEYRNKGIGKHLFKRLGEIAKAKKCARVEWQVLTWNTYVCMHQRDLLTQQAFDRVLREDTWRRDARRVAHYAPGGRWHRQACAPGLRPRVACGPLVHATLPHLRHRKFGFAPAAPPQRMCCVARVHCSIMADIPPSSIPGGAGGYELHQKLRTKVVRLVRKQKYDEAVNVLYDGSTKLLDDHEQGSGVDLALYLLEVYEQAGIKPDETSRGRITTILGKTNADFWRKKVVGAAVKWACHATNTTVGDAPLRLAIAELFAKGRSLHALTLAHRAEKQYYEAEGHYIAASAENKSIAPQFARMLAEWNHVYAYAIAEEEPGRAPDTIERVMAGSFSHRGWIPYVTRLTRDLLTPQTCAAARPRGGLLLPDRVHPAGNQGPPGAAAAREAEPARVQVAGVRCRRVHDHALRDREPGPELCADSRGPSM